jgi:hypothetical protein
MKLVPIALTLALAGATVAASAQSTPATPGKEQDSNNPNVTAANQDAGAQAAARQDSVAEVNGDLQAQYQADMAAYRETLRVRHHAAIADERLYDHQQRAYADAMAQWRHQVWACKQGHNRACELPTPDPANYW